ncbi:MAG: NTP transferase domain-containing protein [Roseobacter sp.]|jgi:GTP:adenosylcobinamide-phosphate guanylyltransferase
MTRSALVLAGSRGPDCPVAALGKVSHKALVPIAGIPMIERVVATLAASQEFARILVSIEDPDLLGSVPGLKAHIDSGLLSAIRANATPALSTLDGFDELGAGRDGMILMTTADNCLLTPEILGYFLNALTAGADVTAAVARTDMVKAAYPEARRTRMRFRDGGQGGCNLFALQTENAGNIIAFWRKIEQNRKSPLTMLRQLGVATALRYVLNRLTLAQALEKLGRRTRTQLATVDMPFAEAAIDVDSPEDFYLAEKILRARSGIRKG